MLRTAKPDTQLPVTPLLLDYLRQLRIKLAVAALFLQTDTQHFRTELSDTDGQFVVLCLSQRLFFAVALRQTHILTPATILTAVTKPAAALRQNFASPVKALTSTPFRAATSLPAAASAASCDTASPKSLLFSALCLIAFTVKAEDITTTDHHFS